MTNPTNRRFHYSTLEKRSLILLLGLLISFTEGFILLKLQYHHHHHQTPTVAPSYSYSFQTRTAGPSYSNSFTLHESTSSSSSSSDIDGVRLNKAFKSTHSRRQADKLIESGRVLVNGSVPNGMGVRLFPGDVVTLDDKPVDWERLTVEADQNSIFVNDKQGKGRPLQEQEQQHEQQSTHMYIKYWKPRGIECTTDQRVKGNIIDAVGSIPGVTDRFWPMGRLDKDTSGLIIMTTDGPTTQRILKSDSRKYKTYLVETDRRASNSQIKQLAEGVRIINHISRDGNVKQRWITTQPAVVERGPHAQTYPNQLLFQIHEGKNRQIRRMCQALNLEVKRLHRIDFAGITLDGCEGPGTCAFLSEDEINILKSI